MGQALFPKTVVAVALHLIATQHKIALGLVIIICLGERDVLVTIPADALHINPGTFPVQRAVVEMVSLQIDRSLTGRAAILALILS